MCFVGSTQLTFPQVESQLTETEKQNLKRKQSDKKANKSKKSKQQKCDNEDTKDKDGDSNGLSEADRMLLERWKSMQQVTKPFIHPIRKYMKELQELKEEALGVGQNCEKNEKPQLQGYSSIQQFQFTRFVPQDKNGNVTGLKAIKLTSNQPLAAVATGNTVTKESGTVSHVVNSFSLWQTTSISILVSQPIKNNAFDN